MNWDYSLFWTGQTENIDGSKFPAFIRLTGYFEKKEKANLKRIELFISNVLPFYKDSKKGVDSITSREIYCKSTIGVTCSLQPGVESEFDVYA